MPSIQIRREFTMPRAELRDQMEDLIANLREKWPLQCEWQSEDCLSFHYSGVKGRIEIGENEFEVNAELGMLMGALKSTIETEITRLIDQHVY